MQRPVSAVRVTEAVRIYRAVLAVASVALGISPFLPWFSIDGAVYTLSVADRVPACSFAIAAIAAAGLVGALRWPLRSKAVGRWVGALGLAANITGFALATVANPLVSSTQAQQRITEQVSAWITWGGWIAFGASAVVLVGAFSSWSPTALLLPAFPGDRGQGGSRSPNARPTTLRSRRGQAEDPVPDLPPLGDVIGARERSPAADTSEGRAEPAPAPAPDQNG